MSSAETVSAENADAATAFESLRRWVLAEGDFGHPVRTEGARLSLSAVIRRLSLFGLEASFSSYSPLELIQLMVMVEGPMAAHLARVALSRAYVVQDQRIIRACLEAGFAPELHGWYQERINAGRERAQELLASLYPEAEALHATRLLIARNHPELIQPGWLWDVPGSLAIIGHHLARAAAVRPDLALSVAQGCEQRRALLMADDPDGILAPLTLHSAVPPQTLLRPFLSLYGDATVIAAARWHLERNQPGPAIELAKRLRDLAPEADLGRLVLVLAALEQGDTAGAVGVRGFVEDPDLADQADLAITTRVPSHLSDEALVAIAGRCRESQPERYLAVIRSLLDRRRLELARMVAAQGTRFAGHPVLAKVFATLASR